MTSTTTARQARPQIVLQVVRRKWLTPHLVRLVVGGPNFHSFVPNGFTDAYVKIFFAKPELGLVPPYDLPNLQETLAPEDLPVTRTYTLAWIDSPARELAIDFVVHGDHGLAGPWAARAQAGETVVFAGPGGGYRPDPSADWHLLIGDESATPAVAAALRAMPCEAVGVALLECAGSDHELALAKPEGIDVHWLHRGPSPASVLLLADAVKDLDFKPGRAHVFAHGERESMKALRDELLTRRRVDRHDVSLSGYWAAGRTEDRFQTEKNSPIGKIL